jgi:hypothetical protein
MNMTPKNIMAKFLAVPIYSTSGVIAMAALIFVIPGGIALLGALLLCWLADRLTSSKDDHIDTTIEQYERHITSSGSITTYGDIVHRSDEDNDQQWADFYNDPVFMDVPKGPRPGKDDDEDS